MNMDNEFKLFANGVIPMRLFPTWVAIVAQENNIEPEEINEAMSKSIEEKLNDDEQE